MKEINRLYFLFAELLDYPTPALGQTTAECIALLSTTCPPAADILAAFQTYVSQESPSRREEIYTNTFDLHSICYPYVGHHLFGESYKRSWFMARLNQGYRENGFTSPAELPDHVAVILRFLASLHPTALGGCQHPTDLGGCLPAKGAPAPSEASMFSASGHPTDLGGCGQPDEFSLVLLSEGLIPAVEKMLQAFAEDSTNPYQYVLRALQLILQDTDLVYVSTPVESEKGGLVNA